MWSVKLIFYLKCLVVGVLASCLQPDATFDLTPFELGLKIAGTRRGLGDTPRSPLGSAEFGRLLDSRPFGVS